MEITAARGDAVMAVLRRAWILVLLAVVLPTANHANQYDVKNGRHNITMGHRRGHPRYPTDFLLFHDYPKVEGSWVPYPRVESHDVCYPPKGSHPAKFSITAFNVTDLVPNGKGGLVYVKEGGVGWGKLCLHLKTQRGGGYYFSVNVWGYYI